MRLSALLNVYLISGLLLGAVSTSTLSAQATGDSKGVPATSATTGPADAEPHGARAKVAVVPICVSTRSNEQNNYTIEIARLLADALAKDKSLVLVPLKQVEEAATAAQMTGFVMTKDEDGKALISKLPQDTNMAVFVGPHPGTGGFFRFASLRTSDMQGATFGFGIAGELKDAKMDDGTVRQIKANIDTALKDTPEAKKSTASELKKLEEQMKLRRKKELEGR